MFIIKTIAKEEAAGEVKEIYEKIEAALGFLPPHTNLFATLDLKGLKEFFALNVYLKAHKRIDFNILPFLRLYIAQKECRGYCKMFNTKILLALGVKKDIVKQLVDCLDDIPLEAKQKMLLQKVLQALYGIFSKEDLEALYALGFSDKDFYDLLNYATIFMAKSKIIDIYLEK